MIRGKSRQPQQRKCQNQNMHISKIGYLLLVCLRNSRHWTWLDQISETHATFCQNQ